MAESPSSVAGRRSSLESSSLSSWDPCETAGLLGPDSGNWYKGASFPVSARRSPASATMLVRLGDAMTGTYCEQTCLRVESDKGGVVQRKVSTKGVTQPSCEELKKATLCKNAAMRNDEGKTRCRDGRKEGKNKRDEAKRAKIYDGTGTRRITPTGRKQTQNCAKPVSDDAPKALRRPSAFC